jgi:hypothetical protein
MVLDENALRIVVRCARDNDGDDGEWCGMDADAIGFVRVFEAGLERWNDLMWL